MKKLRGKLTLAALRQGVRDSGLSDYLKELALLRLQFAEDYIDDAGETGANAARTWRIKLGMPGCHKSPAPGGFQT